MPYQTNMTFYNKMDLRTWLGSI